MARNEKFVYTNSKGVELAISHLRPFVLKSRTGLGTPTVSLATKKLYGMDGEVVVNQSLDVRDIEVGFVIAGQNFSDLQDLKRQAIKALDPKLSGVLTYYVGNSVYEIDVVITQGVDEKETNTAATQEVALQLRAFFPYWRNVTNRAVNISLNQTENLLEFPLEIINTTYEFSRMVPGEIVAINNDGDTPVGAKFELRFIKDVVNPRIYDIDTQAYFGFDYTFASGDVIEISTVRGDKYVTYTPSDEASRNGMGIRMVGSTFLELDNARVNNYVMQADSGVDGILASLNFSPLVLGV
jgi:phage-related protein